MILFKKSDMSRPLQTEFGSHILSVATTSLSPLGLPFQSPRVSQALEGHIISASNVISAREDEEAFLDKHCIEGQMMLEVVTIIRDMIMASAEGISKENSRRN